jgi:phage repressor protein C with HTH and peptisase S24 domain
MDISQIRLLNMEALIKRYGRLDDFAHAVGTNPAYLSQIRSTKTKASIGKTLARKIETNAGLSHGWMDTPHPEIWSAKHDPSLAITGTIAEWDDNTPQDPDDVELPFYKEVELAAGQGAATAVEINHRKLKFSKSTLRAAGVQVDNAVCAIVIGNSMEPSIKDGATVGIDTGRRQVKDGRIYAIDHGGMLRIKYLYRAPGGGLLLHSDNSQEHPDEVYSPAEVEEQIKILGWVFWVSQLNAW